MKNFIIMVLVTMVFSSEYDDKIKFIISQSSGLSTEQILNLQNPFYQNNESTSHQESIYNLKAIVQNHVRINEKWYKLNDTIDGFTITKIQKDTVYLKNDFKVIKLTFKGSEDVKILYK